MADIQTQMGEKGIVGLQNMGNTCYANASLQILRAVPEWSVFCMSNDFEKLPEERKSSNYGKMLFAYPKYFRAVVGLWTTVNDWSARPRRRAQARRRREAVRSQQIPEL